MGAEMCRGHSLPLCTTVTSQDAIFFDPCEELIRDLFVRHDLNQDGVIEEHELIQLNEKIAVMHHGPDVDREEIAERYRHLFRSKLNPSGKPATYQVFRRYLVEYLAATDSDPQAQIMILEQFIAEADLGLACFRIDSFPSSADAEFDPSKPSSTTPTTISDDPVDTDPYSYSDISGDEVHRLELAKSKAVGWRHEPTEQEMLRSAEELLSFHCSKSAAMVSVTATPEVDVEPPCIAPGRSNFTGLSCRPLAFSDCSPAREVIWDSREDVFHIGETERAF